MIKDIDTIEFIQKKSLGSSNCYQIIIQDDRNLLKYSKNRFFEDSKIADIDDKIVFNFLYDLFGIIDSWKKEYIMNNLIDGFEWNLIIKFKDGHCKNYYGKNDSPENFEALENLYYKLYEGIIRKIK